MRLPRPLLSLAICVLASTCSAADPASAGWRSLWNGHDFSGWHHWLGKPRDPAVSTTPLGASDPLKVFTIVDADGQPAIHVSGQVFGGLVTDESFSHYRLRLQFKWGEKRWPPREGVPRDAGLLYDVHSAMNFNGKVWPRSIEYQIQEGDVGDLYAVGSRDTVLAHFDAARKPKPLWVYDPAGKPIVFEEKRPIGNRCCHGPSAEKPRGEWNQVELVCDGQDSVHLLNGQVVMRLTGAQRIDGAAPAPLTGGAVLLQSEGAEVFYRAIEVQQL